MFVKNAIDNYHASKLFCPRKKTTHQWRRLSISLTEIVQRLVHKVSTTALLSSARKQRPLVGLCPKPSNRRTCCFSTSPLRTRRTKEMYPSDPRFLFFQASSDSRTFSDTCVWSMSTNQGVYSTPRRWAEVCPCWRSPWSRSGWFVRSASTGLE